MDMIDINEGLHVGLYEKTFTRPIELVHSTDFNFLKFELSIQDAIKLISVLSQYVEDNNGN